MAGKAESPVADVVSGGVAAVESLLADVAVEPSAAVVVVSSAADRKRNACCWSAPAAE